MVIKEHICEFKIHNNNDVLKFIGFITKFVLGLDDIYCQAINLRKKNQISKFVLTFSKLVLCLLTAFPNTAK